MKNLDWLIVSLLWLSACQLMPILNEEPSCWTIFDTDEDGYAEEWAELDLDGDGIVEWVFCEEYCGAGRCGEIDCATDPNIHPGAIDFPGDDVDDDCDGTPVDADDDGYLDQDAHGGYDCNDRDPERWLGNADLDGDGQDDVNCGGEDCNDNDPYRDGDNADLDGDGYIDERCGGDDCDDDCGGCYPGSDEYCGGDIFILSRDGNCDGVVDTLYECSCLYAELGSCTSSPGSYEILPSFPEIRNARDVWVSVSNLANLDYSYNVFVASDDALHYVLGTQLTGLAHPDSGQRSYEDERDWKIEGEVEFDDLRSVVSDGNSIFVTGDLGLQRYSQSGTTLFIEAAPFFLLQAGQVFISHKYAYVTTARGLQIFDVHLPSRQRELSLLEIVSEANPEQPTPLLRDVFVSGDFAYLAVHASRREDSEGGHVRLHNYGLYVVDVSSPENPTLAAGPFGDAWANGVFVADAKLYLATTDGLEIYDIVLHEDPEERDAPLSLLLSPSRGATGVSNDVFVTGGHAYVASEDGLYVVDVRGDTPETILEVPTGSSRAVHVVRSELDVPAVGEEWYAFVASESGLFIVEFQP